MAGALRTSLSIIFLLLIIVVMAAAGLIWFDVLGVIESRNIFTPVLNQIGIQANAPAIDINRPNLLEEERLKKMQEEIDLQRRDLEVTQAQLAAREQEITQTQEALTEKEKSVAEVENSLNQRLKEIDDKDRNLREQSAYFNSMAPEVAVAVFQNMEDQDVIDIFRTTETIATEQGRASLVSTWMALLPQERAAAISRKMISRPQLP